MAQFSVLLGRKEKISNSPILLKNMSDEEIYQSTRFPRFAVEKLCELVKYDVQRPTARSAAIPVETRVLAALQFFASGSFQWAIGRNCGLSQSSVCLSIDTRRQFRYVTLHYPTQSPKFHSRSR